MFFIALKNVILTLLYILPGFLLCKCRKAAASHLSTISAVLVYVCSPCMILNAYFKSEYSPAMLANMGLFFVTSLVLQAVFILILWLILKKKYGEGKFRVLTIGAVMGNVGFFGLPIIKALFPDNPEVMCYSTMYVISMNMLAFTVGVFCLTGEKKFMSVKRLFLNPSSITIAIAIPLYVFGVGKILEDAGFGMFTGAVELLGNTTTPLCMIILGIRLAAVDFKKLFSRPLVYLTCALKLLIFPLFCYFAVYFLPLEFTFKASVLILSSVPCASVILNLAEMHNGETELAANSVLLSTLACFITIPLLALLL